MFNLEEEETSDEEGKETGKDKVETFNLEEDTTGDEGDTSAEEEVVFAPPEDVMMLPPEDPPPPSGVKALIGLRAKKEEKVEEKVEKKVEKRASWLETGNDSAFAKSLMIEQTSALVRNFF